MPKQRQTVNDVTERLELNTVLWTAIWFAVGLHSRSYVVPPGTKSTETEYYVTLTL